MASKSISNASKGIEHCFVCERWNRIVFCMRVIESNSIPYASDRIESFYWLVSPLVSPFSKTWNSCKNWDLTKVFGAMVRFCFLWYAAYIFVSKNSREIFQNHVAAKSFFRKIIFFWKFWTFFSSFFPWSAKYFPIFFSFFTSSGCAATTQRKKLSWKISPSCRKNPLKND